MGYVRGEPQAPILLFISGAEYYVIKYNGIIDKDGEKCLDLEIEEVESESAGVIIQPRLVTIDGNAFWVWQSHPEVDGGIPSMNMDMEPMEWVISRLKLTDDDLDRTTEYGTIWGIMRRTFPLSSRVVLSDNPEKPIWLLLTNIEGEKINWDNPNIAPLIDLKMQLDRQGHIISKQLEEIAELRDENKKLLRLTKEKKEEFKEIYGEERIMLPPSEFTGLKVDKEGKLVK